MGDGADPHRPEHLPVPDKRPRLGTDNRHPRGPYAAAAGAAVHQADARDPEDERARAADPGTEEEIQERQADPQPGDDAALQGERSQPAGRVPAAAGATAVVLRAVQRPAGDLD